MTFYIDFIADYGATTGNDDLAFSEVNHKLASEFLKQSLDFPIIKNLSVRPFNTVETGFAVAQLGYNSALGKRHIVYHNTAPRKDKLDARVNNAGEFLAVTELPNGVRIIGVFGGYTITLKAGNGKDVKLTAASGGILLDAVGFDCRQAYITAVKGELYLNDVRASNLTVKGGSKQSATVGGNTEVKAVTGFNKVSVEDCFSVIKTLKAPEMKLNGDAVLKVGTGAQVALTKGISGWGEVFLAEGFKPVTLGKGNTGRIRLTADDTLEDKVIFKTKASDLNEVFDVSGIAPQAEDGTYDYGLYVKGGKAYVRAYRWKLNGKTYCEWNDCIKAVASVKPASDATITLLGDIALPGTLKLPARGKYRTLTINGSGHAVIFSGKKVSLTGDLVLRNISLGSTGGAWTLDKGKYSLTGSDYRLTGCSVR